MITISKLDVFPDYGGAQNKISWVIAPTTHPLSDFQIEVQKAISPSETFQTIGTASSDVTTYEDSDVYIWDRSKKYYYRLQVTELSTSDVSTTEPAFATYVASPMVAEIVRRERLLLRDYIKNPVKFFIRKTQGQYCTVCYDPIKRRKVCSSAQSDRNNFCVDSNYCWNDNSFLYHSIAHIADMDV